MINLDLNLLDQDKIRKKKRRKLFIIAALPLLIVLVIAITFLRTTIYNILFSAGANGGNYGLASFENDIHKVGNLIEPYLIHYNSGYVNLAQAKTTDDLAVAENDFRESLKNNPPEEKLCSIYVNLSYAIELRGDQLFAEKEYNEATIVYSNAESVLYENGCATKDSSNDKDTMARDAKKRIEEKRRKAVDAANGNSEDPSTGNQGEQGGRSELTEEELAEIEALQNQAAAEAIGSPYQARGSDTSRPSYSSYGSYNW